MIIQRPPAPMPQLLSSMALCLFREGPITLSGVTPRSKRETEWKFIGRWRRGGEAERKGETRVMDEFDTLARAMWNASAFRLQMTTAKPGFFLYLSLSLFSAFLPWWVCADHASGKKREERNKQHMNANPKSTYLTQVLICHRTGCVHMVWKAGGLSCCLSRLISDGFNNCWRKCFSLILYKYFFLWSRTEGDFTFTIICPNFFVGEAKTSHFISNPYNREKDFPHGSHIAPWSLKVTSFIDTLLKIDLFACKI